jgi:crotonobetaine/carnitine-CoA ligase
MQLPRTAVEALCRAEACAPDRPLLAWRGGRFTVAQFAQTARRYARGLRAGGLAPGGRVAVVAANSEHFAALWYGIYLAGAVEVPVNAELRGPMLQFVLTDSDPAVVLVESSFAERVRGVAPSGLRVVELDDALLRSWETAPPIEEADPPPGTLATIMYTSGTTGPSKGVMLPHGYYAQLGRVWQDTQRLGPEDVLYFMLALFHIDSHVAFAACLQSGATFALVPRFSASRFWADVAEFGATWFVAVGFMFAALARQAPPTTTTLRRGFGAPIPAEGYAYFEDRLGIPLYEIYGQTEADGVTFGTPERRRRGSAGWACASYEVAILSPEGERLPAGITGEVAYRPSAPHMMLQGYWRREAATVEAFRDLWFHSGDLGYFDTDGFLWFVGRMKDTIRRRGENISAFELEAAVRAAPGVADCAAVPVRDDLGGEDEVKVFLAPADPAAFDVAAFFTYCRENLARFAVPRYVELVDASLFVRSAGTGSIQKHLLPAENGLATIDRLALEGRR